ncbi:MAG: hypothetical protein ACJ746_06555 [Bryobacteraceae bacterium]
MKILEPNLILVQGVQVASWIRQHLGKIWAIPNERIVETEVDGMAHCPAYLAFTHLAAQGKWNWGRSHETPYLQGTVLPKIQELMRRRWGIEPHPQA